MVSLRVAAERFSLVKLEGRVITTRQEIRRLQTEMGTRGRLVQLERWNADILALSAPKADQYVAGAFQLANYARPATTGLPQVIEARATAPASGAPEVQTVAYTRAPAAAPALAPTPLPAPVTVARAPAQPLRHDAPYLKPAAARPRVQKVALLDDGVLGEIGKAAASEAAGSHTRR